jgi:glycosyltransferase involved in cell wall biosynthesis
MRVLVISHAAVIPANQAPYCEMERLPDVELALVVPTRWRASVGGVTSFARHERLQSPVIERSVAFSGHVNLHFYPGLKPSSLPFEPDVVYADEDPYSLAAHQASRLARRLGAAFAFKSNQNIPKRYPAPFSWTERAVLRHADAAIAIAPACAEVLTEKGCTCPIEVIGHGIDPEVWAPRPVPALRERLRIPPDAFVIGYVGRLSAEKGVRDLLGAADQLEVRIEASHVAGSSERWNGPEQLALLIVGEGELRGEIEAWDEEHWIVRVFLAGAVPHGSDVADHINCMDVLVVPSRTTPGWKEQFGRVIIEAMACGVPVVGSDSGNIPLLIEETGGGRILPEGDAGALATHLRELAEDRQGARSLGEAGRQAVLERYTYGSIAARIAEVLRRAAERRASSH